MRKIFFILLLLIAFDIHLSAQILYNMGASTYNGNPTSGVPTGWTASAITLNNTFAGSSGSGSFSNSIPSDYSGASGNGNASLNAQSGVNVASNGNVAGLSYYEFTITPSATEQVRITNIDFGMRSTTAGALAYIIRSSLDNFQNDISSGSLQKDGVWRYYSNTLGTELSAAVHTAITIRIYANNSSSSQSPNVRLDDLKISGPTILPISLVAFSAKKLNAAIQLTWSTASEKNNSHFNILRSADGNKYTNIGRVGGNGTVDFKNEYNFTDSNPFVGTNYYQLEQVDFDGNSTKYQIIAITSGLQATQFTISESLNCLNLNIQIAQATSTQIDVHSIEGKLLMSQIYNLNKGYNSIPLAISLKRGYFIVSLISPTEIVTKKFIN